VDPAGIDVTSELLDGAWHESSGQRYLVIDRSYPPGHRHGHTAVADWAPGSDGCWPALALLEPAMTRTRLLFIDLETTGLAGGAGTYAFVVGCAWFDGATFRVRQFLLARYGAERAMLEAVAGTAAGAGGLVTYNGKTFDLPLIETRFLFHRMSAPFAAMPHVDLLHTARRLWRPAEASRPVVTGAFGVRGSDSARGPADQGPSRMPGATCRLGAMEQSVLGHVREYDVPGCDIPSRYFQYVRSGDARPLVGVLEHNRLDLLSLALLTARTAQLLEGGAGAALTAREAIGLGWLYQRGGLLADAHACFARAVSMEADACTEAEALRGYAVLSRRARRYDEAAGAWRRMLDLHACPARLLQEASEALAVHHEHRDENLHLARDLARQALRFTMSASRAQAVQYRLTRLDRKLAGSRPAPAARERSAAPLF
jgi:uncharacterized protein YprB with RNaseH-like and TPR domain